MSEIYRDHINQPFVFDNNGKRWRFSVSVQQLDKPPEVELQEVPVAHNTQLVDVGMVLEEEASGTGLGCVEAANVVVEGGVMDVVHRSYL